MGEEDCSFHKRQAVTDSTHGLFFGTVNFDLPQHLGCAKSLRHFTDLVGFGAALLPGVRHCGEGLPSISVSSFPQWDADSGLETSWHIRVCTSTALLVLSHSVVSSFATL